MTLLPETRIAQVLHGYLMKDGGPRSMPQKEDEDDSPSEEKSAVKATSGASRRIMLGLTCVFLFLYVGYDCVQSLFSSLNQDFSFFLLGLGAKQALGRICRRTPAWQCT